MKTIRQYANKCDCVLTNFINFCELCSFECTSYTPTSLLGFYSSRQKEEMESHKTELRVDMPNEKLP